MLIAKILREMPLQYKKVPAMNFMKKLTIKRRLQVNGAVVALALLVLFAVVLYEARVMSLLNSTLENGEELTVHELSLR